MLYTSQVQFIINQIAGMEETVFFARFRLVVSVYFYGNSKCSSRCLPVYRCAVCYFALGRRKSIRLLFLIGGHVHLCLLVFFSFVLCYFSFSFPFSLSLCLSLQFFSIFCFGVHWFFFRFYRALEFRHEIRVRHMLMGIRVR